MSSARRLSIAGQTGAVSMLMVLLISVLIFGYMSMQIQIGARQSVAQITYLPGDALQGLLDSAVERSAYRYKSTACGSMVESSVTLEVGVISVDAASVQGNQCVLQLSAAIGDAKRTIEVGLNNGAGYSAWAIGARANVTQRVSGAWQLVGDPYSDDLNDIFCFDSTSCWVVGDTDALALLSNGTWTAKNPSSGETYRSIACSDSNTCFVAGSNGTGNFIRRWNGSNWNSITYVSGLLLDIQCPTSVCYAVGKGGLIMRYNGSWSSETNPITSDINALACLSVSECWAVTANENKKYVVVHRNDSATWQSVTISDVNAKVLRSIDCSNNRCWAGGDVGYMIRLVAGSWSSFGQVGNHAFYAMSCRDSDNACIAVGNNGVTYFYNGSAWSEETSATNHQLNAVAIFEESAATSVSVGLWREMTN